MLAQNMVVNVTKDQNTKITAGRFLLPKKRQKDSHSFRDSIRKNNISLQQNKNCGEKGQTKIRSRNQNSVPNEKQDESFGFRKRRKLFLQWPRDIFYQSRWLNKLMNKLMRQGKKGLAEKIVVQMMTLINQRSQGNAILIFHEALDRIKPVLTVVSRRVGRRIYEIPVPIETMKQYKLALKWLVQIARKNSQLPVAETLANEILNTVFFKRSEALKRKNELYDLILRNRAYTHYRWI